MGNQTKETEIGGVLRGIRALVVTLAVLLVLVMALPDTYVSPEETMPEPTLPAPTANPYGPEDFRYDGPYLTCTAGKSVLGIDVSAHQGEIDWQQVADAGVEFVMIRVAYRGYKNSKINADPYAQANYEGAKAAGLKVGVYIFSQAVHKFEAMAEADFLLRQINGWKLDMPVVYDWEYVSEDARTGNVDARTVTDCTIAFCETIERAGYRPMVYFNTHQASERLFLEELLDYPFWLAMYTDQMTYAYKVDMWQYTDRGRVPGIEGNVDINLWFP